MCFFFAQTLVNHKILILIIAIFIKFLYFLFSFNLIKKLKAYFCNIIHQKIFSFKIPNFFFCIFTDNKKLNITKTINLKCYFWRMYNLLRAKKRNN